MLVWHVSADSCLVQDRWTTRAGLGIGAFPVLDRVSNRARPAGASTMRFRQALATGLVQGSASYQPWDEPEFRLQASH